MQSSWFDSQHYKKRKKKREGSKKGGKKGRQDGRDKWGEWIAILKTSKQEKIDTKP